MCVGSPTAGTWSSSQWRLDNEFETDTIAALALVLASQSGVTPWSLTAFTRAPARIEASAMSTSSQWDPVKSRRPISLGHVDVDALLLQGTDDGFVSPLSGVGKPRIVR